MRLPGKVLDAYNRAVKQCGDSAEVATRKALNAWLEGHPGATIEQIREVTIAIMTEFGTVFGQRAGDAAYALRAIAAKAADVELPAVSYDYAPDPEFVEKTARYQVGKLIEGDRASFVDQIADASRYFAERGANDTMHNVGKVDAKALGKRVRWARVPTGATTCPYCLMLASRGFVYRSEAKTLNANHRHCDCRIIEGFEGMEVEGYDPDLYYDMWKNPEKYQEQAKKQVKTQPLRMTGKETFSYYSSDADRIRDWLRGASEFEIPKHLGRNNDERVNLLIRRDADMLRELLRQSEKHGLSEYVKTLEDFKKKKDDEKELFVHASIIRAGLHLKTRKDDNKGENETSVDLKIDGAFWEIKSPTSDGSAPNSLGFVERNLKKARRQFSLDKEANGEPVKVIFNCRYTTVSDGEIEAEIRKKMHLPNIGVSEVILVCKDGKIKTIN